jgi:hypothetical protein
MGAINADAQMIVPILGHAELQAGVFSLYAFFKLLNI